MQNRVYFTLVSNEVKNKNAIFFVFYLYFCSFYVNYKKAQITLFSPDFIPFPAKNPFHAAFTHTYGEYFSQISQSPFYFLFFCVLSFFLVDFRQCRAKLLLFCTLSNRIRHSYIIMPIWTKRMRIFQKRSFQRLCFLPQ